ncbi:uncharacterized protein LOC128268496 [Anopheles cruzii]|uniref:uncharacterized protein LOC128268496 n=1 Tax=Anopheles cruzii TaxID=68878 RepID=UPI0022EC7713|nr:uncharacterized protein LOC128268496 [Anopheles cruzii]
MASINLRAPRTSNATDFLILRLLWSVVKAPKLREEILRWVWIAFAVVLTTKIPSRESESQNLGGNKTIPHSIVDAFKSDAQLWEMYLFWGQLASSVIWFFVVWCKNQHLTVLFVALFKPHWLMTCVCYGIALINHVYSRPAFWFLSGFILLSSFILDLITNLPQIVMTSAVTVTGVVVVWAGYNNKVGLDGIVLLLGLCFTWDSFKIVKTYGRIIAARRERIR